MSHAIIKVIIYPDVSKAKWARSVEHLEITSKDELVYQLPSIVARLVSDISPRVLLLGKRNQIPLYEVNHYEKHREV